MKVYNRIIENKPPGPGPSAVALGFFDGVHTGHQKLIRTCVDYARESGLEPIVHTFYSMPKGEAIESFERRVVRINALGASVAADVFDEKYMSMSPQEFIDTVVIGAMNARAVFAGSNHTFGRSGTAGARELEEICRSRGIDCFVIEDVVKDGEVVSSRLIKELIRMGEMEKVSELLGRYYEISGIVSHGRQVGRTIGVPTANIEFEDGLVIPRYGVYLCRSVIDSNMRYAIANVGVHPTFTQAPRPVFEPFFLDFSGDMYGEHLEVSLIKHMRDEMKFSSPDELKKRLEKDEAEAREYITTRLDE